jgi:long-subunit fatty acid transport protein
MAVLFAGLALLFAPPAFASGFFTPDVGTRTMARGGATVIGGDDLTALYVNVANLANITGTNIYFNVAWDIFHTYYRREPYLPADHNMNPFDPVQFAGVSSDFGLKNFVFAYGVYGPYGVTNRWPSTGPQRYDIIEGNSVQVYETIAAAWKPADWLRVGAEACLVNFQLINYYGFSVLKDRNPAFDVTAEFNAKTSYTPSWGAGFVVSPVPHWFELGFSYLPDFHVTVTGLLSAQMPPFYGAILKVPGNLYTDGLSMPLHYPPIYRGGARFIFPDKFDIEVDAVFIPWSVLQYYDVHLTKQNVIQNFKYPLGWKDTWNYRFGGTYRVNDHWRLMTGYQYEGSAAQSSVSGTETPKHIVGGGFTMRYFGVDLDIGYNHIFQSDVVVPPSVGGNSPLDDGRGHYKTSYDLIMSAVNINIERMYYAFNGKRPW